MKYPKINTLWKRDDKGKIIEGEYAQDEFPNIKRWQVTEKVDGMNIRIHFKRDPDSVGAFMGTAFYGRTDNAQIPKELHKYLQEKFPYSKVANVFDDDVDEVWLFGEGFGPKIQSGGDYADTQQFILFDVWLDGIWLERDSVDDIAKKLEVQSVPVIGTYEEDTIEQFVQKHEESSIGKAKMEGVVCRPVPLMLDRRGNPIMMKLKVRDYR